LIGFSDKLRYYNVLIDDLRSVARAHSGRCLSQSFAHSPFYEFPLKSARETRFAAGGHVFAAAAGQVITVYNALLCERVCCRRADPARSTSSFYPRMNVYRFANYGRTTGLCGPCTGPPMTNTCSLRARCVSARFARAACGTSVRSPCPCIAGWRDLPVVDCRRWQAGGRVSIDVPPTRPRARSHSAPLGMSTSSSISSAAHQQRTFGSWCVRFVGQHRRLSSLIGRRRASQATGAADGAPAGGTAVFAVGQVSDAVTC
jgi:hypothetical protein